MGFLIVGEQEDIIDVDEGRMENELIYICHNFFK